MLLDTDGHEAEDVGRNAHAPLHLGDDIGCGVDVKEREVRLAVLLDLVGEVLQTPVFGLGDLSAAFGDGVGIFFGHRVDLALGNILACQEDMLVERHAFGLSRSCCPSGA